MESNLSCQNLNKNYNNSNKIIYDLIFLQISNLIKNKDEYLFSEDNKSLKNIKFKRSSFVFNKIRKNWHILNINDKTVVWKYLNFILKLLEQV